MTADVRAGENAHIPLDQIEVTDRNPRKTFDEDALESLTRSIREKGLLQPILVRPISENGDEPRYELVSGERRLRAHRRLEAEEIRAEVRELTAQEAAELRLVENIEREDLHELEEAAAYRELLEGEDWSVDAIADQVGRSESYVYSRLSLVDLVDEAREAFLEGPLSFGHARLIARLDEEEQKKATRAVTHYVLGFRGGQEREAPLSVKGLRAWIDEHLHLNLEHAPFPMADDELYPEMGACTDCPFRSGTQPALFADVDEPNICTKPACYEQKVERTIARKVDQLREEGVEPLVGVVDGHRVPSEDDWEAFDRLLALGSWHCGATRITDDNRCGAEIQAVCIGGSERGEHVEICLGEDCEEHVEASTSSQSVVRTPFVKWGSNFRRERRRWRRARRHVLGRRGAEIDLDFEDVETFRMVVLRVFDAMWADRMRVAAEQLGWPDMPKGYLNDEDGSEEWREAVFERIQAMDHADLVRALWVFSLAGILDDGRRDTATDWPGTYGVEDQLAAQGVSPLDLREATTERRVEADEKILPEYVDTVIHSGDPDEEAHLVAEGAGEARCGHSPVEGHAKLRPGDEELDDVEICEACLRAFFDAEIREEPADEQEDDDTSTPEGVDEEVYRYVRERMEENPDVENKVLKQECEERFPDVGIDDLSLRQFHARYPLQVKRAMVHEGGS